MPCSAHGIIPSVSNLTEQASKTGKAQKGGKEASKHGMGMGEKEVFVIHGPHNVHADIHPCLPHHTHPSPSLRRTEPNRSGRASWLLARRSVVCWYATEWHDTEWHEAAWEARQ
jgi:hypothetical protein